MGLLDRLLLTVYTLALMVFSALTVVVTLGDQRALRAFQLALLNPEGRWVAGVVSCLVFVSSVRLLYSAFAPPRMQVVHETELGDVRISREAVEHLVQRVARQVRGVRDVRARVALGGDGVVARARIWVSPDVGIPGLAHQLQDELRRAMREVVGVELSELTLHVENIATEGRRVRVE
jgi:uncharacterized alkaline shock family protein YloU